MRSVRITAALVSILVVALANNALAAGAAPNAYAMNGAGGASRGGGGGIVGEAERWLSAAAAGPTAASDPTSRGAAAAPTGATADRDVATPLGSPQPFASFTPSLSLVARDWRGSMRLMGTRTMLVDDLRPTASNRMVLGRLATDGRLSGFMQLGVGEWRIDTVMFPSARSYSEVAGQLGTGFELRLTSGLRVGGEAQYTMLYRDLQYTSDEVAPRIMSFVVAFAGSF